jgi:hypothetical protein
LIYLLIYLFHWCHCFLVVLILLCTDTADFSSHFCLFLYFMSPTNTVVDLGFSYRWVGCPSIHLWVISHRWLSLSIVFIPGCCSCLGLRLA